LILARIGRGVKVGWSLGKSELGRSAGKYFEDVAVAGGISW
jgi:hypothetical protein